MTDTTRYHLTPTLACVLGALDALAARNADRMTEEEDRTYQLVAAHGAGIARACGDERLAVRLEVACITCHHCDPT